jgi:hypothetical protein
VSESRPDLAQERPLSGRRAFLSASIPDRNQWQGEFDPLEITDAVIACVSAIWTAGGKILCGGHPAITPLLLRVAHDFKSTDRGRNPEREPLVTVYQSELYRQLVPAETRHLEAEGLGRLEFVPAEPGDRPRRPENERSLERMRAAMLAKENDPAFAVFIGGMDGIRKEYDKFHGQYEGRPVYAFGAPGGEARELAAEFTRNQEYRRVNRGDLLQSAEYGALMDDVLADVVTRMEY